MPTDPSVNPLVQFMPFILIAMIFYFLVFQPERAKQSKRKEMLKNVKKNDEVVTVGGVHGTVVNVKDTTVIVRVDDNVKIEFDKESVVTVVNAKS